MLMRRHWMLAAAMAPLATMRSFSADWPWFFGPTRDGAMPSEIKPWKDGGPREIWSLDLGEGFSGPVVGARVVYLFHRENGNHLIDAVEALSGKRLWRTILSTSYEDPLGRGNGPRSTPALSEGRLFIVTPEAGLFSFDCQTGKELWKVDLAAKYAIQQGFFGYGVSPLVHGQTLLLNVGGEGAGIVCFSTKDGSERWKVTSQQASYASGVLMRLGDRDLATFLTREGLLSVEPESGQVIHKMRWRSRQNASVNAASPVAIPGGVFLTSCYNTGGIALREKAGRLEKVWSGDESLSAHYATPIYHEGHLYGFHGRQEEGAELRCVEANSGKVMWSKPGTGCGWILRAGGSLLVMQENGQMLLLQSNPKELKVLANAQVFKGQIRALPAFSDGVLYCRDSTIMKAFELVSPK